MTEDPNDILYSPFAAAMADRTPQQQEAFLERFSTMPDDIREFFTSLKTVEAIKTIMETGELSGDYDLAITKIVAFAALGDVPPANIEELLIKLGVSPQQAADVSQKLLGVLAPIISARAIHAVPTMSELPPLTQKIPPMTPVPDSSKTPARNIIDLRKQQTEQ
ncbi:MAG: hypothetical protein AAB375_01545 [Patescibacteria group bacterium]